MNAAAIAEHSNHRRERAGDSLFLHSHSKTISLKNTFLDFRPAQEPLKRRNSWSHGLRSFNLDISGPPSDAGGESQDVCRVQGCTPCLYFMIQRPCDGSTCGWCHLRHDPRNEPKRSRPRRVARETYQELMENALELEEPERQRELQRLAAVHPYYRGVIIRKLKDQEAQD
eukprot:s1138_g1.t1